MARTDLETVVHQAMAVGLTGAQNRQRLMRGLPMGFVYSLPVVSRPIDQLRFDLMELERTPRLIGLDAPPLAVWLKNAAEVSAGEGKVEGARLFAGQADQLYPAGGAGDVVEAVLARVARSAGNAAQDWGVEVSRDWGGAPGAERDWGAPSGIDAWSTGIHSPPLKEPTHPRDRRYVVLSMHPDAERACKTVMPPIDPQEREFIAHTPHGRWYDKHAPNLPAWQHAVENLDLAITDLRAQIRPRDCLAVFAIAPPALGALLGARLRERLGVVDMLVVFERMSNGPSPWQAFGPAWSSVVQPASTARLLASDYQPGNGDEVTLLVELSGPLNDIAVEAVLSASSRSAMPRVTVKFDPQRPPRLEGSVDIETAVRDLREIVRTIEHRYRRIRRLHVFYRGPLALMIRLGQHLGDQRFRSVVYVDRGDDGYLPAVQLGGSAEASLVRGPALQAFADDANYDAFIVSADGDRAFAGRLYDRLVMHGLRVFLDERSLRAGDIWTTSIPAALQRSRHVIALISPASRSAWYQNDEIAVAIQQSRASDNTRKVVPVLLDGLPIDNLPYGLRNLYPVLEPERDVDRVARAILPVLMNLPPLVMP